MKVITKIILTILLINFSYLITAAQVAINEDGNSPDASAILDVSSTDKGILIPRMTTLERAAISSPATGLLVYDTDFNSFWYYTNTAWNNLSDALLTDTDADTKIQVEESSDEDIIRFDLGGTEYFKFNKGRIEVLNIGNSVFLGEGAGLNNTTGSYNTLLGSNAGEDNTIGVHNTYIGRNAGIGNTTGSYNTYLGSSAGEDNEGSNNTMLGYYAGEFSAGSNNVFIGYQAGSSKSVDNALFIENSSSSLPLIYGDFELDSVQINGKLNINGAFNFPTIDGDSSQILMTDGSGSLAWSDASFDVLKDTDSDTKIQVEESADEDIIRFDLGGTEFLRLDNGRIEILNTGNSISIGEGSGENNSNDDSRNIFLGHQAGHNSIYGHNNVYLGYQTGYSNNNGYYNTFSGASAGYSNTDGYYNTFSGASAGYSNTIGEYNTFYGANTGYFNTTGDANTFSGYGAGKYNTTGKYNTFVGSNAGSKNETGDSNVFLGISTGDENTTGNYNVYLGSFAGDDNTTGENNVFIGYKAGDGNTTGTNNIFLGANAGSNETGDNKLYIDNSDASAPLIYGEFDNNLLQINGILNIGGSYDFPTIDGAGGQILTTDGSGTAYWSDISATVSLSDIDNDTKIQVEESSDDDIIRFDLGGIEYLKLEGGRLEFTNTGSSVLIGQDAGVNDDYTDNRNVFIGHNAGETNSSGRWNVFTGYESGNGNQTGKQNVFTGFRAGYNNTTGENNNFMGYNAGNANPSGVENTFLGDNAGYTNETGSNNVFVGHLAGYNNQAGSNNILIGNQAGYYATGDDKLYIDNSNTTEPLIYGDFDSDILEFNGSVGIGTTPTNAIFEVLGSGDALASYTYGYLNNSGTTGTWTNAPVYSIYSDNKIAGLSFHAHSDERIKNIQGVSNSKEDLNTLMNIEITDYTMKDKISNGDEVTKKVIAQQVKNVYPQAVSTNTIQAIPDIYQTMTIDENGWIYLDDESSIASYELKVAEKIQIIFENKKEVLEVLEVKENAFRVKPSIINSQLSSVFIYGRQVSDFHTVDYEAISMLNLSATQQLAKEVEQLKIENEVLKNENSDLKDEVSRINILEAKLQGIEAQLNNQ